MEGTKYTTKESVLKRAMEIKKIPLREIDTTGRLSTGKGAIGTVIEECWFGYSPNSESEPDFPEAGIELKVTPYVKGTKGIRAKERLVCNIINYMEEFSKTFRTSSFWHKCNTMLLMSYEHIPDIPKGDFCIDETILFSFPEEDLIIIEQDWMTIIAKIRDGKAHEISEGDTLYLAACTKGATSASVRSQPFSTHLAKQRAYSLKSSYMTRILNRYVFGNDENPKIIKSIEQLERHTLEEYVISKVSAYYGKTQNELKQIFNITSNSKALNEILLARMLGISGRISQTEEFQKAGIVPKTIRVQHNGKIKECMSFPNFDFIQLSNETDWEKSELYNYLAPTKFMFVIFQEGLDNQFRFSRIMFWNIPEQDLEQVRLVWERTIRVIREGVQFIHTHNCTKNNFPKQSENPVAHVRPHAKNKDDTLPLPDGREMPKQCFWLNNTYIEQQISLHK